MEKTLSERNPYYISRERTMELEHFCKQMNEWHRAINNISFIKGVPDICVKDSTYGSEVEVIAELRDSYLSKIDMLERAAEETDPVLGSLVLYSVTRGIPYEKLRARKSVPCGQREFYALRRKFFSILSDLRG